MYKQRDLTPKYGGAGVVITDKVVYVRASVILDSYHENVHYLFDFYFPNLHKLNDKCKVTVSCALIALLEKGSAECDGGSLRVSYGDKSEAVSVTDLRCWRRESFYMSEEYRALTRKSFCLKYKEDYERSIRELEEESAGEVVNQEPEGTYTVVYTASKYLIDVVITAPPLASYVVIYKEVLIDVTIIGASVQETGGSAKVMVDQTLPSVPKGQEHVRAPDEVVLLSCVRPTDLPDGVLLVEDDVVGCPCWKMIGRIKDLSKRRWQRSAMPRQRKKKKRAYHVVTQKGVGKSTVITRIRAQYGNDKIIEDEMLMKSICPLGDELGVTKECLDAWRWQVKDRFLKSVYEYDERGGVIVWNVANYLWYKERGLNSSAKVKLLTVDCVYQHKNQSYSLYVDKVQRDRDKLNQLFKEYRSLTNIKHFSRECLDFLCLDDET